MHHAVMEFTQRVVSVLGLEDAMVLEVGAYDVNGSVRPIIEGSARLRAYLATDMRAGPGVDLRVDCTQLDTLDVRQWDMVVCCEMLEHAEDWRKAVSQMKKVLKPGGWLLLTTRSHGFPLHDFPHDYWRFELDDAHAIFADMEIVSLEPDPQAPGILLLARKPQAFTEVDLWDFSVKGPQ